VVCQSARVTNSAQGATSLPQMGAVSESLEQRLLDSLQFPFDVSIKSERLKGSVINQSSTRCTHLSKKYALSRFSTESGLDAGIPQAEARNANECARGGSLYTFYRACTRAIARLPENN
jgi:hypothetical protein